MHNSANAAPTRHFVRPLIRALRDLRVSAILLVLTLLPSAAAGEAGSSARADENEAKRARDRDAVAAAYVIHVPGIAGPMRFDSRFGEGLVVGGAGSEVEIFDWVGRRRGLPALYGLEENKRQAVRLAKHILELKRAKPQRALVITAHSGGTAIVAWALEMLPEMQAAQPQNSEAAARTSDIERPAVSGEVPAVQSAPSPLVDGVIFIASGLSPDYDLSPMLRQVRGRVFHLSSEHDNLILGAGTILFGTLDRKNGLAAGKGGFVLPAGCDEAAYARFCEVPYDKAWMRYGHYGDHEGMMTTSFAAAVMSDLVRASMGLEVPLPTTRPAGRAPAEPDEFPDLSDKRTPAGHVE